MWLNISPIYLYSVKYLYLPCSEYSLKKFSFNALLTSNHIGKRYLDDDAFVVDSERKRLNITFKWNAITNYCKKPGHKYAEWRAQQRTSIKGKCHFEATTQGPNDRSKVTCFKCNEIGHFASLRPKGRSRGNDRVIEKRVDICSVAAPSGTKSSTIVESALFCFESGA